MPFSTPVNKKTLKHHWDYSKWKYILLIILSVSIVSLVYTATRPQAPDHSRINIYVQNNNYVPDDLMHQFMDPIWHEFVPQEEELNVRYISNYDEYEALQVLFVTVHAKEGDIYMLPNKYFRQYASQGAFIPLEGLIEEGKLNVEGIEIQDGYTDVVLEQDINSVPIKTENHLYGIPMGELFGFAAEMQMDNRDMYACIATDNGNMEDVITFFNEMLQKGRGEKPDWMIEADKVMEEEKAKEAEMLKNMENMLEEEMDED